MTCETLRCIHLRTDQDLGGADLFAEDNLRGVLTPQSLAIFDDADRATAVAALQKVHSLIGSGCLCYR